MFPAGIRPMKYSGINDPRGKINPNASRPHAEQSRRNQGFTLIEIIIVVVIILIMTSLTIPNFARSYKGARLRAAARSIAMMHRYARSIAALQQKQAALLYDIEKNTIELAWLQSDQHQAGLSFSLGRMRNPLEETSYNVVSEMTRELPEKIRISDFDIKGRDQEEDGIYFVNYYPGGMCDNYAVRLKTRGGDAVWVEVDHLSGAVSTEYE